MERPKNQQATQLAYVKREASFKQMQNRKKIKKKAYFSFWGFFLNKKETIRLWGHSQVYIILCILMIESKMCSCSGGIMNMEENFLYCYS